MRWPTRSRTQAHDAVQALLEVALESCKVKASPRMCLPVPNSCFLHDQLARRQMPAVGERRIGLVRRQHEVPVLAWELGSTRPEHRFTSTSLLDALQKTGMGAEVSTDTKSRNRIAHEELVLVCLH
mmetsp:Transcript_15698/g.27205  ORF Transcript_15698/g.27205 Transcript_15698/m.27205 type:complete len:126 (+) Transcript_15698:137-514(+)